MVLNLKLAEGTYHNSFVLFDTNGTLF